jgi:hypothetical protein
VSKFQSLLDVANSRQAATPKKKTRSKTARGLVPPPQTDTSRRGRPAGKRSDPAYEQVTAYIRRDTHKDVKIALLQNGQGREFSELVEELLAKWLESEI